MICFRKSQLLTDSNSQKSTTLRQHPVRLSNHLDRLENLGPDRDDPIADHLDLLSGNDAQVEDSPLGVRATVIDPDDDTLAVLQIDHPNLRIKRELLVGGGAVLCVIMLPVGREPSNPATSVKGGLSHLHRDRFGLIEGGTGVRFGHGTTGKHHRHE